jgi:hypothetical protein
MLLRDYSMILDSLDYNYKSISRMINTAKLLNESTAMIHCRLTTGMRLCGRQTVSRALSSSPEDAILAPILSGRRKEFCI